jgi:pimeloyl-ACP methyl ester carboxylesterase
MDRAKVNGVELEYEVLGSGEPVLLIDMLIPDCFGPILSDPSLASRYQLIRYHKRGWVGSTHTPPPVSIQVHAADAEALLDHLGVRHAHVVGHSTGASIGAQLALDHPEKVHTLTLLEPTLVSLPLGQAFLESARPVFEAYANGDHGSATAIFVAAASGLEWDECRALLEERIPGAVTQCIKDADTFFGVELQSLPEWRFGPEQAATIRRPVLSVIGAQTAPMWVEIAQFLRASLPYVEECAIEGAGHLLQIQQPGPVARAIAEFLGRNSISG